jgi:hypothetical protein
MDAHVFYQELGNSSFVLLAGLRLGDFVTITRQIPGHCLDVLTAATAVIQHLQRVGVSVLTAYSKRTGLDMQLLKCQQQLRSATATLL